MKNDNTKTKIKYPSHAIYTNEDGGFVEFEIPFAGLHYDRDCTPLKMQDKIDDTKDRLCDLPYYREDEAMIYDDIDRNVILKRLKKNNRWI
jgi:hypothetical protein